MKITVRLAKRSYYELSVKSNNQLDAAAEAVKKGQFYGCKPYFIFKENKQC
jgi:hypothetical protein